MPIPQPPKGPFCQSCGMPLSKPEDFGTDEAGFRVNDYCHYCYVNGAFMNPGITMPAMIDLCVDAMVKQGVMPASQARPLMAEMLPRLKRWQRSTAGQPLGR